MKKYIDPLEYFKLRPIKAAKVSEVSEATASSSVPAEEKVNFHIGNPVQDKRLSSAYLRMILGIEFQKDELNEDDLDAILEHLEWEKEEKTKLEFFIGLIKKSAPYMPRGGFKKGEPSYLVKYFNDWLIKNQQEPLSYHLGETSGNREIILASGGIYEALRILFHALSEYLVTLPANVLLFAFDLPLHLTQFPSIEFKVLSDDEKLLLEHLHQHLVTSPGVPTFLLLGKNTTEETRRTLRQLSLEFPLFFVEVNNAPNHLSLAREAKMMNRVLRLMTPEIFSSSLKNLSIVFLAGNSDFIRVIENIHFQLKGTPSASEVELLSFILKEKLNGAKTISNKSSFVVEPAHESFPVPVLGGNIGGASFEYFEKKLDSVISRSGHFVDNISERVSKIEIDLTKKSELVSSIFLFDHFSNTKANDLLDECIEKIDSEIWTEELSNSFLYVFLKHHPEYRRKDCLLVSGSSRSGLGLLGFHCGIKEVVFPDLSWTYEHCFPSVSVVSLTDDFELDVDAIIASVDAKISMDPNWNKYGAVALNNPHNATGQEFNSDRLKLLLKLLLERNIFIIDDLSYQNVAPVNMLKQIKTIRQLTDELLETGYVTEEQSDYVITIHSLSKTDSFAGARLSVIEIRNRSLFKKFKEVTSTIRPNIGAIFLAYLFYRNKPETANAYWRLRNSIFETRMHSLADAVKNLPPERNRFNIKIKAPKGSMYPQMMVDKLPSGLSLDWLASGLARQGIGLIPLSTFARTEKGFETGRKTFRLTLGGTDDAEILLKKTRRVLIDLNRMIAEEAANYNLKQFAVKPHVGKNLSVKNNSLEIWNSIERKIVAESVSRHKKQFQRHVDALSAEQYEKNFIEEFLPERLAIFKQRFSDRLSITNETIDLALADKGKKLIEVLENEFFKDSLERREKAFKQRLYDRTVHPTQMYSLKVDLLFEELIGRVIKNNNILPTLLQQTADELIKEFLGLNVAIVSGQEPQELVLDLNSIIAAENYTGLHSDKPFQTFLSFWGDWDGSNRPSGQGHSLVAAVLIENVARQCRLLQTLLKSDKSVKIDSALLHEIEKLPETNKRFSNLLNEISSLTHQLEKRFRGILPFNLKPGKIRRMGMRLHVAQDPLTSLWHHNDRLERKMLELRKQRKDTLEYYFSLNKKIRKALYVSLPSIQKNLSNQELALEVCLYKDLLKRFIITPRIHQKLITAQDQFAIDTTIHNMVEINEIAGKYGNPGMVMALQVSMSTKPEALISLDRKMRAHREQILRDNHDLEIPSIWLVPLFEDIISVKNLKNYLNKIWEYSLQSRRLNQETRERFAEIITEIFVAGSDLSQQVGQTAGMNLYKEAKHELTSWLAEKGLIGIVRMKMGSGEPMQRQGGYYSPVVGKPAFIKSPDSMKRFTKHLNASTKKSTEYAATPLLGVFAGGDLRTFQSNISEKLRHISVHELAQLLYHVKEAQKFYENEIIRAGEPLVETRLQFKTRGLKELERLTVGRKEYLFEEFLSIATENFRQILYGREEDVVGIHVISYFISRTTPPLRDRPTVRPGQGTSGAAGQKILERIAETIPFSRYGSLLRAISHNQSQTAVLGINQLTTGLFRALDSFSQKYFDMGESVTLIEDRILPNLPVYEILHTLRTYHDVDLTYLNRMEKAFPAGNSAFLALREDIDSLGKYLILFQRELLRRHGLNVTDFFEGDKFIPDLLPTLRSDLAIVLQPDFFNTDSAAFLSAIKGTVDAKWFNEIKKLLLLPEEVKFWRAKMWNLLEQPVTQRVASFVELAIALYSLSSNSQTKELSFAPKRLKLPTDLSNVLRMSSDDNMHQFLAAAFEYLSVISEGMVEVPINIIRAIKEVERIIKIEEQALSPKQQDLLRFYLLQIARLTGENG
ncbi:MAG: aminotransferase class I/II-fold pyridoxal phosphate-dependent enzyme [Ignavibacteriaceae bacterium]|jgi:aspartate/methionine/tyrosine aminotransferase